MQNVLRKRFAYLAIATVAAILFSFAHAPVMASAMHMDMDMDGCQSECNEAERTVETDCLMHCVDAANKHSDAKTAVETHTNSFDIVDVGNAVFIQPAADDQYRSENKRIPWIEDYILKTQQRE